jgi:hypothetical protein
VWCECSEPITSLGCADRAMSGPTSSRVVRLLDLGMG